MTLLRVCDSADEPKHSACARIREASEQLLQQATNQHAFHENERDAKRPIRYAKNTYMQYFP